MAAHSNAIVVLDNTGMEMINQDHFKKSEIRQRLDELHRLWELLLSKLAEKGMRLQQALVLVQFLRQCDEVMFWINDKETFVTTEEFGHDLEHVEVLQRKFDEFQKDMASQEFRVTDVCETADKLVSDQHPESSVVTDKKAELLEAWARLKALATERQQELFVAYRLHQIGTWLEKQKALLSSQDFGDSPEAAEALIKKIDDLLKSMDRERKKVPPAAAKKPAAKKPAAKKGEILLPSSDCPPGGKEAKAKEAIQKSTTTTSLGQGAGDLIASLNSIVFSVKLDQKRGSSSRRLDCQRLQRQQLRLLLVALDCLQLHQQLLLQHLLSTLVLLLLLQQQLPAQDSVSAGELRAQASVSAELLQLHPRHPPQEAV